MLRPRDDRPGWIINLTNDGWFGISTGPYQHLQQARLRAIEEGLPLVRAANTGISAVIDPSGRIVARLGLGIEGVLDASLPAALPPTVYARLGDIPAAMIMAAALLLVFRRRAAKRAPEICNLRLLRQRKTATARIHQLTDRPAIRFLRLQAQEQQPVSSLLKSSAILPDPPSRI